MTGDPQWWREFERQEALRMERADDARERMREWRAGLEWENMRGRYPRPTEWRDTLGPEWRFEAQRG